MRLEPLSQRRDAQLDAVVGQVGEDGRTPTGALCELLLGQLDDAGGLPGQPSTAWVSSASWDR